MLFMPNITFSVPDDLYKKMKDYPYIKWTELYRDAIKNVLDKITTPTSEISTKEFFENYEKSGYPLPEITIDEIIKTQERIDEIEWERVF